MCWRELGQIAELVLHGAVNQHNLSLGLGRRCLEIGSTPATFSGFWRKKKKSHSKKKLLQVHMTLETPWHPDLAGAYTEAMVGGPHEVSSRGGAEARTVAPQHPRTFQSYQVLRSRHKTPWM